MRQQLLEKQRELINSQKRREEELLANEQENRLKLEEELKAKDVLLQQTKDEAERIKIEKEKEALQKQNEENRLNMEKDKH